MLTKDVVSGKVIDLIHCPAHSSPLAVVEYDNGETNLMIAPHGISVDDEIKNGGSEVELGNTIALKDIPDGTLVYNIEAQPGDGGKFVRASGTFARVAGHNPSGVVVEFPSKKKKEFNESCRATIGNVAGGGRPEAPLVKAGTKYHKMRAKNKLYPKVSGSAMNAVDHPFGNKRSSRKSKARPAPRNAPPGRKVGMLAARRTGKKKG